MMNHPADTRARVIVSIDPACEAIGPLSPEGSDALRVQGAELDVEAARGGGTDGDVRVHYFPLTMRIWRCFQALEAPLTHDGAPSAGVAKLFSEASDYLRFHEIRPSSDSWRFSLVLLARPEDAPSHLPGLDESAQAVVMNLADGEDDVTLELAVDGGPPMTATTRVPALTGVVFELGARRGVCRVASARAAVTLLTARSLS